MDKSKITFLSEMVANFLSETIENEVKTAEQANLETVVEFAKTANGEQIRAILSALEENNCLAFDEYIDDKVAETIENSSEYIKRDDIDTSVVDELGLSEDVANEYIENLNAYDLKDFIKNQIDNL